MLRDTRLPLAGLLALTVFAMVIVALTARPATAHDSTPSTAGPATDVVVVRCDAAGRELSVSGFQGSTRSPAARSTDCAETLSLLVSDGFAVRDVGHYDESKSSFALYTLSR